MRNLMATIGMAVLAGTAWGSGTPTPADETDLPRQLTKALNDTPMPKGSLFKTPTGDLVKDAAGFYDGAKGDVIRAIGDLLLIFDDSKFTSLISDCGYSIFKGSGLSRKIYLRGFLSENAPAPNAFMNRLLAAVVGHFDKVVDDIEKRAESSSWSQFKCDIEVLGYPLFKSDYYVDQGDAAMMVATVKAIEANFYFFAAHDLDSMKLPELIDEISGLLEGDAFGSIDGMGVVDFIRHSDRFLRPIRTDVDAQGYLTKAQTLFMDAIGYLQTGDGIVRARTDEKAHILGNSSDGLDHAVTYHSDGGTIALLREHGSTLKSALSSAQTINLAWVEDLVELPQSLVESRTDGKISLSLAPLFVANPDVSTKMPQFKDGKLVDDDSLDCTLGGLAPDLTKGELLGMMLESMLPKLTGEWKFPKGNELRASVGRNLSRYTESGKTEDFAAVDGIESADGAMRAGQWNSLKCYHGLRSGEPYTFIIDLKVPSGVDHGNGWLGYLWSGSGDALAFLKRESGTKTCLWSEPDHWTSTSVTKDDEWHRYVLTTDCASKKILYVDGVKTAESSIHLATLTGEVCYLLGDNSGEDCAMDVSYAAFYSGVMSDAQVKLEHSRPIAHNRSGIARPTFAPSGVWSPSGPAVAGEFGVPLVSAGAENGWTATRVTAPATSALTVAMDCRLASAHSGAVLVKNAAGEAVGVYASGNEVADSLGCSAAIADFDSGLTAAALFGGRSRARVSAGEWHRLVLVRSAGSDAALMYYLDGEPAPQLSPYAAGSGLEPSAAMNFFAGDWKEPGRLMTWDAALAPDEIRALGDASTAWPYDASVAPTVTVGTSDCKVGAGRDEVTFTVGYSHPDGEAGNVSIDFGDGTGDVVVNLDSGETATFAHTYATIGRKEVLVRAIDRFGAVATASAIVRSVDASYVAYALWIGEDFTDLEDASKWRFLDAAERKVDGGKRGERTALLVRDFAALGFFRNNLCGYPHVVLGNVKLAADLDWSDYDLSQVGGDSILDLNGRALTLGESLADAGALEITDSSASGGQVCVVVDEGKTVKNVNVGFTGSLTLVKEGDGTFVQAKGGQFNHGGTTVQRGTLRTEVAVTDALGAPGAKVQVAGGTLKVDGGGTFEGYRLELAGGTLKLFNGGTLGDLTLSADSTLIIDNNTKDNEADGFIANGSDWDFCGRALTLRFEGTDPDLNAGVADGVDPQITFHRGTLLTTGEGWLQDRGIDASDNVCYDFSHVLRIRGSGIVRDFINRTSYGNDISRFSYALQVTGRFTPLSQYCYSVILRGGATIDLSDKSIALPWDSTMKDKQGERPLGFAQGARITLDLTGRAVKPGDQLLKWESRPTGNVSFSAVLQESALGCGLRIEDDGIYADVPRMDTPLHSWTFDGEDEAMLAAAQGDAAVVCADATSGKGGSVKVEGLGGCARVADGQGGAIAIPQGTHLRLPVDRMKFVGHDFTLRLRFMSPAESSGKWRTFFQTDASNKTDGGLFIHKTGDKIGGGWMKAGNGLNKSEYGAAVSSDVWHELYFFQAVTPPAQNADSSVKSKGYSEIWLDDTLVAQRADMTDDFFSQLTDDCLLVAADDNGEDNLIYVSQIDLYDKWVSREDAVHRKTGEWHFDDSAAPLKASIGADLEENVLPKGANDFTFVPGTDTGDGALRTGQYNSLKCHHGLKPGAPYTFVIDLKIPSGITREKKYHGYLWNGSEDALAFLVRDSETVTKLWHSSGQWTSTSVAKDDEWHRYVLTTDCANKKVLYVDGKMIVETSDHLATLTGEVCYLLGDDDGEDCAMDVSYAAFYEGMMTDDEVAKLSAASNSSVTTWQQDVGTGRFTIMCETDEEMPGLALKWGEGQVAPFVRSAPTTKKFVYRADVSVEGQAGETIDYELAQGSTTLTHARAKGSVRLWPAEASSDGFTAVIWGDNQSGAKKGDWDADPFAYVSAIFTHMMSLKPDFAISTGDMSGSSKYDAEIGPLLVERTNRILGQYIPYYVAYGNHDAWCHAATPITRGYFANSDGNRTLYRDGVLFVLIDYAELWNDGVTRAWLESVLSSTQARQAKFRVVVVHEPVYVDRWGDEKCESYLETFNQYRVDLVFSGHTHEYERIEGVRAGDTFVQIVNGCAGYLDHNEKDVNDYGSAQKLGGRKGVPYLWARQSSNGVKGPAAPVVAGCLQGYGELSVKGDKLTYRAHGFDANGDYIGVFDAFTLTARTAGQGGILAHSTEGVAVPATPAPAGTVNAESFVRTGGRGVSSVHGTQTRTVRLAAQPVTKAQWAQFEAARGRACPYLPGEADLPAVGMSRREAEAFAAWVSGASGVCCRLPTEAELAAALFYDRKTKGWNSTCAQGPVSEWTSTDDETTGWCRILGGNGRAESGLWTSLSDLPAIATPGCSANYLGFRLAFDSGLLIQMR